MGVIETARELAELVQKLDNIELNTKILDLQEQLFGSEDEKRKLRAQVEELEENLHDKRRLTFRENAYWDEETNEGPYCSACRDSKRTSVRMHVDRGQYNCPVCKAVVVTEAEHRRFDAMVRAHNAERDPYTGY